MNFRLRPLARPLVPGTLMLLLCRCLFPTDPQPNVRALELFRSGRDRPRYSTVQTTKSPAPLTRRLIAGAGAAFRRRRREGKRSSSPIAAEHRIEAFAGWLRPKLLRPRLPG